jgi:glycosyltransferase involved in cell wall biosynthesis
MEALACGVPVVCTKVGFHGENLEDRKNVLFVKRISEEVMNAIHLLYTNQYVYNEIKESGISFARSHHNLDITSKQFEVVIMK